MPRLPVLTGEEAVRRFERIGYVPIRQRGSHIRMRHTIDPNRKPMTIPVHRGMTLKPGLLRALLRQAGMTVEEFVALQ